MQDHSMEFAAGTARVAVNVPDWARLEDVVRARMQAKQGFALATLNLDHLVKLRSDPTFAKAYAAQDFVVADGNPIVWLSRLAGRPVDLIPGSDAILPLCRIALDEGVSVALVGSTPDVLAKARIHLTREVEGLSVSAMIAPPFGFDPEGEEAQDVLAELMDKRAGLVFVAMGAPKQERFAAFGRQSTTGMGFVSIGAGLDFFAGQQRRAPAIMRKLALEWLWRMVSNPARLLPRYARCVAILPGLFVRSIGLRRA